MTRLHEPLFFHRILKDKIWGADRLGKMFNWEDCFDRKVGESWMLSDVPGEESEIRSGQYAGKTLRQLMESNGEDILGLAKADPQGRFPLLIKFLDTSDLLSVQVHPDDQLAAELGEAHGGKTESWYFLGVEEGCQLSCGLKDGTDANALEDSARNGSLGDHLAKLDIQAGQAVHIPAGLVHALGPGFTLAEVQQTSDLTYRLFDWNRMGDDGKPRELHLEKALKAVDFKAGIPKPEKPHWRRPTRGYREGLLVNCPYFKMSMAEVDEEILLRTPRKPIIYMVVDGVGEIGWGKEHLAPLDPGDLALIPATIDIYRLRAPGGRMTCLMVEPGPF